ncbi:MAG: phospholipase D family protein [Steroidobacteraceae bacterium]
MLLMLILLTLGGMIVGALLANHLMPKAVGEPSHALEVEADATELDRALEPMLAGHPGHSGVVLINDGFDAFAVRALAARSAGRSLDLQYYMWRDDLCGRLLALEVWRAAERGVRVRMLVDDMNAHGLDRQMLALDAHPNIELRLYNAFRNRRGIRRLLEMVVRALRINHRMHNKAWIADGRVAIVGGRNVGEEYFGAAAEVNFRDLDLLLIGPAVAGAETIFDRYWNSEAVVPLAAVGERGSRGLQDFVSDIERQVDSEEAQAYFSRVRASSGVAAFLARERHPIWSERVEVVADPPHKWRTDDRQQWLVGRLAEIIDASRVRAWLISPYFVPGQSGTERLLTLVRRGVDVGIVTNSLAANDVPAVHGGYARYRKPLLAGGAKLRELRAQGYTETAGLFGSSGASLHTKAIVVDGQRGFVGSFNVDARSAALNTEMGVLFDDPRLGAALEEEYRHLASPALSFSVQLGQDDRVRWEDHATQPPTILKREPGSGLARRVVARVLRWLPIESQL